MNHFYFLQISDQLSGNDAKFIQNFKRTRIHQAFMSKHVGKLDVGVLKKFNLKNAINSILLNWNVEKFNTTKLRNLFKPAFNYT